MLQDRPAIGWIGGNLLGELLHALGIRGDRCKQLTLQIKHYARSLLASLNSRLVICVGINQLRVDGDRSLKQSNQRTKDTFIDLINSDRCRAPPLLVQRRPRPLPKSIKVVTSGNAVIHFKVLIAIAILLFEWWVYNKKMYL